MKVQAEWKVQIKNTSFLLFVNEIVNCTKFVVLGMQSFQLRLKFWKTKLISYQRQFLPNNNYQWYCPHVVSVSVSTFCTFCTFQSPTIKQGKLTLAKLQNTPPLWSASRTCVGRLWRSRHNTIDAIDMLMSCGVFWSCSLTFQKSDTNSVVHA